MPDPKFCRKMRLWYLEALKEINIDRAINEEYIIFPKSHYERINSMPNTKTIDFWFIGSIYGNIKKIDERRWLNNFVLNFFTKDSHLQYVDEEKDYKQMGVYDYSNILKGEHMKLLNDKEAGMFDENYYTTLKKSKFSLCPAGDCPWSMRFYEAIMCKAIPIVEKTEHSWRSSKESKIDYKYYLVTDKDPIYRKDWAEHNYNLFLTYHTFEKRCLTKACGFLQRSDHRFGPFCCHSCKNGVAHGTLCEKVSYGT